MHGFQKIRKASFLFVLIFVVVFLFQNISLNVQAAGVKNQVFCDNLTLSPDFGYAPLNTTASIISHISGGEKILSYKFDFGDGSPIVTQSLPNLSHKYASGGAYLVKGYVVGKLSGTVGGTGTCQKTVTVVDGTVTVDKISVVETLAKTGTQSGLLFGTGFNLTSQGATAWQIRYNEPTSGQGFYESSGGIVPGQTIQIRSYLNGSLSAYIYSGSAVVQYYKNGIWSNGPTISYSLTLTDGTLSVDTKNLDVTLSRASSSASLVFGPGFTITSQGATGWSLYNNTGAQGQGFYESSGGINVGQSQTIRTYVNASLPNGTYSGSYTLYYIDQNGYSNPSNYLISYTIHLVD